MRSLKWRRIRFRLNRRGKRSEPGLVVLSIHASRSDEDDEGADYCNDRAAQAPDYPFAVARNTRIDRHEADATMRLDSPVGTNCGTPWVPNLSSGSGSGSEHIVLDVFFDDAAAI